MQNVYFGNNVEEYQKRYGGYWRFSKLKDFYYLENPKFPTREIIERINSLSKELITKYPSNIEIQSLIATNIFDVNKDEIVVGNGSAELIKIVGKLLKEKILLNIPIFNEYIRNFKDNKILINDVSQNDYFYNKDTIINLMDKSNTIVIVNPDNPSGNFIEYKDIIKIIEVANYKSIKVIVDESFIDFSDEDKRYTLINHNILEKYKNLIVIKSISKSYGVPGIRLGVLASGDKRIVKAVKDELEIWNINSIAEYFMQIVYLYNDQYKEACNYIATQRKKVYEELIKLKFLYVYKSQANYIMCKLLNYNSDNLTEYLLKEDNILIKNLKEKEGFKDGNYIRISIKTEEDNKILINALKNFYKSQMEELNE